MIWHWAVRDLLRHRARTALSLLGVAIATALLLDMVLLSGGIDRSFGDLLLSRGFQVRVTPSGTLPFDTDASIDSASELIAAMRRHDGVAEVGGVLGTSAFVATDTALRPVFVYGITPNTQGIYQLQDGRDLEPSDTNAILIGHAAATALHLAIGDTVQLAGRLDPDRAAPQFHRVALVVGVVHFIYDAPDQVSLAATLPLAQRLTRAGADPVSMLMVRIAPNRPVAQVTAELQRDFPRVTVQSVAGMLVQFRLRLSYFRQMSLILGTIALIVTVLLVGTLLAIAVNERAGEIAALRAIGIARRTICAQIVVEGLMLTVVGGSVGTVLGVITSHWLDSILTSFPGLPSAISFFVAGPSQLAWAAMTLLLTGLMAGLWPAWRAGTTPIAAALRSDAP